MRLDELTIEEFKNLRDLKIDFDETSPYTVLVGQNGAGKSNLLEALTLIFRHLDLEERAPFGYSLKYRCRSWSVKIDSGRHAFPQIRVTQLDGSEDVVPREISRREFMEEDADGPLFRPAFVFGYYSGPSDRLARLFDRHRERFYEWIIRSKERRGAQEDLDPNSLRRLFYAETLHGQFALIAFFMQSDAGEGDREFLREHLQIDGLDSVLFVLRRPGWRRGGGDPRFWNAVGEVQEFLDRVYDAALLPARMNRRIQTDLTRTTSVEHLYLFLPGKEALERVYGSYADQYAFFTALESMHLSQLLGEVRTRVRTTRGAGGTEVTYRDLSEGEQQLLLVLGLLKFTARTETLFLLDEPDTHLNPAWSTQYLRFLDRFIPEGERSHVIMSTHDPLVFAGLTRPQVRVFARGIDGRTTVSEPMHDPQGMGIQAILASELFGLASGGLDEVTLDRLRRQRELASKVDLAPAEEVALRELTDELNLSEFWKSDRDPLYQLFLERFIPRWAGEPGVSIDDDRVLTPEEAQHRRHVADRVAAEIAAELAAEHAREQ